MLPHVNDHMSNIYKVYAPYIVKSPSNKYKKLTQARNIDKYYEYYNIYKPQKKDKVNIIPNRKLSPIRNSNVVI
jgi:hypothetical protein